MTVECVAWGFGVRRRHLHFDRESAAPCRLQGADHQWLLPDKAARTVRAHVTFDHRLCVHGSATQRHACDHTGTVTSANALDGPRPRSVNVSAEPRADAATRATFRALDVGPSPARRCQHMSVSDQSRARARAATPTARTASTCSGDRLRCDHDRPGQRVHEHASRASCVRSTHDADPIQLYGASNTTDHRQLLPRQRRRQRRPCGGPLTATGTTTVTNNVFVCACLTTRTRLPSRTAITG